VGTTFEGNTPSKVAVAIDDSKVTKVEIDGKPVHYLAADAVKAGRYALFSDGDRRMALVDIGGPAELKLPGADGDDKAGKGGKAKGKAKKR